MMPEDEKKPKLEQKTSMEILSELFSTFDAEPPVIVKKEKEEKHKKGHKKHKKEKKHKKKSKKRKRSSSSVSSASSTGSAVDLSELLIKREKGAVDDEALITETLKKIIDLETLIKSEAEAKQSSEAKSGSKIVIKDLKNSKVFSEVEKKKSSKRKKHRRRSPSDGESDCKRSKSHKDSTEKTKRRDSTERTKHRDSTERTRHSSVEKSKHGLRGDSVERSKYSSWRESGERIRRASRGDSGERTRHTSRGESVERLRRISRGESGERTGRVAREEVSRHKGDLREKIDEKHREDKYRSEHRHKAKDDYRYRDYRRMDYDEDKRYKHRENPFYKEREEDRHDKWFTRDKYRSHDRDRERFMKFREDPSSSSAQHPDDRIDKKKLLEIARRNAIQMMKSGSLPGALTLGPQAQEKVIAAIRSGGKTVEELTDFCKTLSKKEELGELSSVSEDNASDESDGEQPFHHPFQIKDKPLTINIKNSVPLPIKTNQERASELRIQFPVSSGQQHRKTESEWVPVTPKKVEQPAAPPPAAPKAIAAPPPPVPAPLCPVPAPVAPIVVPPTPVPVVPAPVNAPPGPQVFPMMTTDAEKLENIDIASIVSQRLTAMRKLQENPNDVQAITQMYKAQKEMNTWAESKQQIGQFTGSTGAQILSQAELSSGYQAWARKDQLQTAAPVTGGMGMHLLQKMGWKPGEGLGKEKTGALEPLLLEVKLDKKGIVAKEEQNKKKAPGRVQKQTVKTLQGKHPVSLLGEYASKRKLGAPQYVVDFECGPDHKKNFLFKVVLNGVEYKPNIASGNKKEAKATAATVCLQQLGLLPS